MTALLDVGAGVGWPDLEAAAAARRASTRPGRVAELVEWLAATQGSFPPKPLHRPRCVVLGAVSDAVVELAARYDVGIRTLELPTGTTDAFELGSQLADREIDEGADLIVLAGRDDTAAPGVLASVLTGAEPVALLPRGASAVDTAAWITAAQQLRDGRRAVAPLRSRPAELLAALASPVIAVAAGFSLRAAVRRTGVVFDGAATLAAGLLCVDSQPRCREWWQLADTSTDPAQERVAALLERKPLLDLGAGNGDGSAGLLALEVLRTVAATGVVDE